MWSRRGILLGLLAAAGCGLRPVHGPGGAVARRGMFALQAPQTRDGYAVLQQLELRFGAPADPQYRLRVDLDTSTERVADDAPQNTQRDHMVGVADWTLRGDTGLIGSGRARRFVSYAADDGVVQDEAARDDARARLADALADEIQRQVWAVL